MHMSCKKGKRGLFVTVLKDFFFFTLKVPFLYFKQVCELSQLVLVTLCCITWVLGSYHKNDGIPAAIVAMNNKMSAVCDVGV